MGCKRYWRMFFWEFRIHLVDDRRFKLTLDGNTLQNLVCQIGRQITFARYWNGNTTITNTVRSLIVVQNFMKNWEVLQIHPLSHWKILQLLKLTRIMKPPWNVTVIHLLTTRATLYNLQHLPIVFGWFILQYVRTAQQYSTFHNTKLKFPPKLTWITVAVVVVAHLAQTWVILRVVLRHKL